jgi:signal transduction histidine kinase
MKDQDKTVKLSDDFVSINLKKLNDTNVELERELSHRKMLETQARLAFAKEKELNQLKSKFVSMASHEFRTPLSCILTSVSLLDHYIGKENINADKSKKHINIIKKSIRNLSSILDDFLSYDNINQGRVMAKPVDFYLEPFLEDIIKSFNEYKSDYNISLQFIGEDVACFQCENMLKNIINNILSNAVKYSKPEEPIIITSKYIDDKVHISIQDHGIGIPFGEQSHIFDTFYRAENVLLIPGTGLGLAIAKSCLDIINGDISFESIENKTTTFYINFPAVFES